MTEMNTAPQLAPRERCTGCAACCNGCPKGAIRMVPDREGFLYPQVTDGCVQCGHCTHICPVLKQREPRTEPAAFIVWNGDEAVRRNSTAGGAFSALAEYVLEGGGVVFGAALDSGLRVSHIAVKNRHDLPRLRGSKPVQSDVGESYQQVRLYLDQGRQVLFSGTPCQVDGLYRYLGEHPERLITCDVACSGVGSPGVWEKFVRSMAYIKQQKPLSVDFRGKLNGESTRRFHVTFENGGQYDAPLLRSEVGRGLARGIFLRPACHTCGYTSTDRTGDLTLCDMTGGAITPEEKRLGVSLLLINTAKGAQVFQSAASPPTLRPGRGRGRRPCAALTYAGIRGSLPVLRRAGAGALPPGLRPVPVRPAAPRGRRKTAEGTAGQRPPALWKEETEMTKTLLHTCCAPCSVACIQLLRAEGIEPVSYWYNPNIHPYQEYKARRDTLMAYAPSVGVELIVQEDYGLRDFCRAVAEDIHRRCGHCYRLRLEQTARYAAEHGFQSFSSTLFVSPYQDHELLRQTAEEVSVQYGVTFLYRDFRPGFRQGQQEARELGLYMQKYCGCVFSEEDRYAKQISRDMQAPEKHL